MKSKKQAKQKNRPRSKQVDWKSAGYRASGCGRIISGKRTLVAVSPDRDEHPIRCFDCFTADLQELRTG